MQLQKDHVYRLANGRKIVLESKVVVSGLAFFRGVTQDGEALSFDERGNRQFPGAPKSGKDIVEECKGELRENFKTFVPGTCYSTIGGRVWEVVAICRDENFPIIANELLPNDTFHANIKRFNWDGKPHDGSGSTLWKKTS